MFGILTFFQIVLLLVIAILLYKVYQSPLFWSEQQGASSIIISVLLLIAVMILKVKFKQIAKK
jgi:hypothetical protein